MPATNFRVALPAGQRERRAAASVPTQGVEFMNTRRFVLHLAVAIMTFLVGWTAAVLFGATRAESLVAPPAPRVVVVRDFGWQEETPAQGFDDAPLSPCGRHRMHHAFEWREMQAPDFDAPLPPPAPPSVRRFVR
jgi:hypothetical protein